MDGQRFDALARAVARVTSRRALVREAVAFAAGGKLTLHLLRQDDSDSPPIVARCNDGLTRCGTECCDGPCCGSEADPTCCQVDEAPDSDEEDESSGDSETRGIEPDPTGGCPIGGFQCGDGCCDLVEERRCGNAIPPFCCQGACCGQGDGVYCCDKGFECCINDAGQPDCCSFAGEECLAGTDDAFSCSGQ